MDNYEILADDKICAEYINGTLQIVDEKIAPLFLSDFRTWVEARAISENRGYVARSLKTYSGLSALAGAYETSLKANAACVTDNYWVRKVGSDITYADISYDGYKGELSALSLGLESDPYKFRKIPSNPELTNIGNSDKAWMVDDNGVRWLYKKQETKECYREVLASKIAKRLGVNTVDYEFVPIKDSNAFDFVRSRDFTQNQNVNLEHIEFVLKHYDVNENDLRKNVEIFREYGCEKDYLTLKYFDIIIGNPDRHPRNYGLLRNRETGNIIGLAPNYDNNFAFRADLPMNDFVQVALEEGFIPPMLSDEDANAIISEMKEYDCIADINTVLWKQRSVIGYLND